MKFLIITPVYNSEAWIGKCIKSAQDQSYTNFKQIIVDDGSTDNTIEEAQKAIGEDPRFALITKENRQGALHGHILGTNLLCQESDDEDVVVHLDGDDWFSSRDTLQTVKDTYDTHDCWVTYGSYECTDPRYPRVNRQFDPKIPFRDQAKQEWIFSQLRTFKKFLWRKLTTDNFNDSEGRLLTTACDAAIFIPILEMASSSKVRYISDTLYIYNRDHMNDDRENPADQIRCSREALSKAPHTPFQRQQSLHKFGLVGDTFAGDKCATHGKEPKVWEWVPDGTTEATFHVDQGLFQESQAPKKYGWILESQAIIPNVYANAIGVLDKFECIFTHSQELLDLDPRFKLAPVGTHWIKSPHIPKKSKNISMIASNKIMCLGHAIRHGWINRLHGKLDFFGKGFNPIENKEEGLSDYRFSVAIENCSVPNYFTEKIGDCFATGTIPVYIGCTNIDTFFNPDGIIHLTHELELESLTEELYLSKLDAVKENFELIKQYEIPEDWIYNTYFHN